MWPLNIIITNHLFIKISGEQTQHNKQLDYENNSTIYLKKKFYNIISNPI